MIRSKLGKAFIIGFCLTIISSGAALANTGDGITGSINDAVSSPAQGNPAVKEDVLQKQNEIDQYVFVKHKEDIAEKGFEVTHTVPLEKFVEIGITPYSEENANYLYEVFGKDLVKVVEGQQAVTLNAAAGSPDDPVSSPDQGNPAQQTGLMNTAVNDNAAEINTDDNAVGKEIKTSGAESSISLPYTLGAAILLGGTAIVIRRMKVARR